MNSSTNQITIPGIAPEVIARVVAAANTLYAESGHQKVPTVTQVRHRARAGANEVNAIHKEWRQTIGPVGLAADVEIPEPLRQSLDALVASAARIALEHANARTRSIQAAWDTDRAEREKLQTELGNELDQLTQENEAAQERIAQLSAAIEKASQDLKTANERSAAADRKNLELEKRAQLAEQHAIDIAQQVEILKRELQTAQRRGEEITASLRKHEAATAQALQETAHLRGQLKATQTQLEALMKFQNKRPKTPKTRK